MTIGDPKPVPQEVSEEILRKEAESLLKALEPVTKLRPNGYIVVDTEWVEKLSEMLKNPNFSPFSLHLTSYQPQTGGLQKIIARDGKPLGFPGETIADPANIEALMTIVR